MPAEINDGAAALLIASEDAIKKYNLNPIARITTSATAGVEPRIMGMGPLHATQKIMSKAGISIKNIDLIEMNEAFCKPVFGLYARTGNGR